MAIVSADRPHDPFALLIDGVSEYAIYMLDRHGFVRTWNPGAQRIKGYAATDVVGQHVSLFYTADDVEAEVPTQQLETAVDEGNFVGEGLRVRKDGSTFSASVVITSLWDENGRLRGFAKVVRDLTDRQEAERDRQRLQVLEVKERVVHDLHDELIQRLFRTGIALSAATSLAHTSELRDRLLDAIDELDATISYIRLAAWADQPPDDDARSTDEDGSTAPARPFRVLVVDDDPDIRQVLSLLLRAELSVDVVSCGDAYQALAALDAEPFDAVVLDLMLPGISGMEMLARMVEGGHKVLTVVLSGMTSGVLVDKLSEFSFVADVLAKPIDLPRLTGCLQELLSRVLR